MLSKLEKTEEDHDRIVQEGKLLQPNRIQEENLAFLRAIKLSGLSPEQIAILERLHLRYASDLGVRKLANSILEKKDFKWKDTNVWVRVLTEKSDKKFAVYIPSMYQYANKNKLNLSTGKILYGIFLGVAQHLYHNPDVVDTQFVAQNIVNRKLARAFKAFGFYLQNSPSTLKYADPWHITGVFLAFNLYTDQVATSHPAIFKKLVLDELSVFDLQRYKWKKMPVEEFNIFIYQAVRMLRENGYRIGTKFDLLKKINSSQHVTELSQIVGSKLSNDQLEQSLKELLK
jgi:hypothetical protein